MATSILDLMNHVQQQGEVGRARGTQSRLADLASRAYTAAPEQRTDLVSQMIQSSPQAGMQFADQLQKQEDDSLESLGREALMFSQTAQSNQDINAIGPMYARLSQRANRLGLNVPEAYDPKVLPMIEQFGQTYGTGRGAMPSGYNEFQLTTNAAGLKRGSPEYQEAAKVRLGLSGRASGAAIGYQKVTGPDGREYLVATDPRQVGATIVGDGASYGSGVTAPGGTAPGPQGGDPFSSLHASVPGLRVTSQFRTPEENARLPNSVPNSFHLTNEAIDLGRPTPEQRTQIDYWAAQNGYEVIANYQDGHVHLEPKGRRAPAAGPNPFVSRAPEDTEYAKQRAKNQADLDTYRQKAGLEIEAEASKAGARSKAEADAERSNKAATRSADAQTTLSLLDEAERILPGATGGPLERRGSETAALFGKSTSGAQATARLNLIAAQLVSKVPRFEGPQSNTDVQFYREAAGDLANPNLPVATRQAALQTMRELNQKYASAGNSQAGPRRLRYNPQTGRVE